MAGVGVVRSKIFTFCLLRSWRDRNHGILGNKLNVLMLAVLKSDIPGASGVLREWWEKRDYLLLAN